MKERLEIVEDYTFVMPLRIAAAFCSSRSSLARCRPAVPAFRAANDNGRAPLEDRMVRAALRHFGAHGLNAARNASQRAAAALLTGEVQVSRHWLDICTLLGGRRAPAQNPRPDVLG